MITGLKPENIQRILLCQQRQIGDVVLATPAIELLATKFPNATIDFFTEAKCLPILENNPHLNHIWALDKKIQNSFWSSLSFYWKVAQSKYDIIIALQNLPRIHWICALSSAKYKLSNTPKWYNRIFFTQVVPQTGTYSAAHKASVLKLLDIEWDNQPPKIYLTEAEKTVARELLFSLGVGKGTILITLDPTHRRSTRKYPLAQYAEVVDALTKQYSNIKILPIYGPGEKEEIFTLYAQIQNKSAVVLTPNMLSLREMASVLYYSTMHIGNCSSPRHIATAVGTPTITILGSTDTTWRFPSPLHIDISANLRCQPCYKNVCPLEKEKNACLNSLPTSWVLETIIQQLMFIQGGGK